MEHGGFAPGPHRATITEMRSSDPDPRPAYAARGRVFPAPAQGRPRTPEVSKASRPDREKVKDNLAPVSQRKDCTPGWFNGGMVSPGTRQGRFAFAGANGLRPPLSGTRSTVRESLPVSHPYRGVSWANVTATLTATTATGHPHQRTQGTPRPG
jgi:hypothetical protein